MQRHLHSCFFFPPRFKVMADTPYTIVVLGNGSVQERRLADHLEGTLLPPSVTVVSNSVTGGLRTVVLTRKLAGASPLHYTFDPSALLISFINAIGSTPSLSYHQVIRTEAISRKKEKERKNERTKEERVHSWRLLAAASPRSLGAIHHSFSFINRSL
jgi:hypothetical protein